MLDNCLSFFDDSLDIPIGVQAIKKVFLSNPFSTIMLTTTSNTLKESIATQFVGLTKKFMVDMETLKIRDLIQDRKKSNKNSVNFKQASIKLCDYFIRIRKEPLLVPIIRIMKFMVPGARIAVKKSFSGVRQAISRRNINAWSALNEIEKVIENEKLEETTAEARNKMNQEKFDQDLIAILRPRSQEVRIRKSFGSLISGNTVARSLFIIQWGTDLFNGDVVILRNPGSFATIDSASGSIAVNSFGKIALMDFGNAFP